MDISKEQISSLKEQVLAQINSTFPEEKKQPAIQQIQTMNSSEFIEFLKQNNLIKDPNNHSQEDNSPESVQQASPPQESPFRQIIQGKLPSSKVGENEKALAVLEINPISPGHTIIIPKEPAHELQKLPELSLDLAKEIEEKIKQSLKPKRVLVEPSSLLGEIIINIIPIYKDESSESQRKSANQAELDQISQTLLSAKPEKQKETPNTKKPSEKTQDTSNLRLPKRIP